MNRIFVALPAMALLGACASNYVAKPYVAGPQRIERVAIADDSLPESLSAVEVASIGSNFGLIGALVTVGVQESREAAMTGALEGVAFDAEETLERYMVEALGQQGIQAAVLPGAQRERRLFLARYPAAPEGVQAYYDIVLTDYGYVSAGHGQPWRPTAEANVRLVSVSDGKTLLENRIAYNRMNAPRGVITLAPNPEYVFETREEMVTRADHLADGIKDALQQIAATTARLVQ